MAISRRTVLRGLGTSLALPFLDAMMPAFTASAKIAAPLRFSVVYIAHGICVGNWVPAAEGTDYEMTMPMRPLEKFRDRMLLLTGIDNDVALTRPGDPRGGHGRMAPAFMCGVHAKPTQGTDFRVGVSIDQIAANQIGQDTTLPSLQMSLEPVELAGSCDSGYSCVYTNTLSWRGPTSPLPMENNPRAVFERLFGDSGSSDPAIVQRRLRQKRSILDSVLEKATGVSRAVGATDRTRFDDYLQSIRDVERRIQNAEARNEREIPVVEQPDGIPEEFPAYAQLMFDLQILAYQADLTRVGTFLLVREISGRSHPEIGESEGHHSLSHHGNDPEKMRRFTKVNVHYMTQFATYLEKLQAIPDGDGSLLDHTLVLYGSNHGDANKHDPHELPIVIFGADKIKGGRHIRYDHEQLPNLHVTLLNTLGVPVEKVGESTGKIELEPLSLPSA